MKTLKQSASVVNDKMNIEALNKTTLICESGALKTDTIKADYKTKVEIENVKRMVKESFQSQQ